MKQGNRPQVQQAVFFSLSLSLFIYHPLFFCLSPFPLCTQRLQLIFPAAYSSFSTIWNVTYVWFDPLVKMKAVIKISHWNKWKAGSGKSPFKKGMLSKKQYVARHAGQKGPRSERLWLLEDILRYSCWIWGPLVVRPHRISSLNHDAPVTSQVTAMTQRCLPPNDRDSGDTLPPPPARQEASWVIWLSPVCSACTRRNTATWNVGELTQERRDLSSA